MCDRVHLPDTKTQQDTASGVSVQLLAFEFCSSDLLTTVRLCLDLSGHRTAAGWIGGVKLGLSLK